MPPEEERPLDNDFLWFIDYFAEHSLTPIKFQLFSKLPKGQYDKGLLWHAIIRMLSCGESNTAEQILAFVKDPNALQTDRSLGLDPLMQAMDLFGDRPDIIRWLLKHGADPNSRSHNHWNSLHYAAVNGFVGCVGALLDSGMPIDDGTIIDDDRTALMEAADRGHLYCVMLLVARGADWKRCSKYSKQENACEIARRGKHQRVVDFLEYVASKPRRD